MSIVCSVVGHKASSATVWNRGHHFSTCTRCRADLVESEQGRWITPPAGYRIVRKQPEPVPETCAPPASQPAEPSEAAEPKSVWDEVRSPEPMSPLQEKRTRPDRRVEQNGSPPTSLAGVERRRGDRRESKGNYQPSRRKGLIAQ